MTTSLIQFSLSIATIVLVIRLALYPENRIVSRLLFEQCRAPRDYSAFLRLTARLSLLQRHESGSVFEISDRVTVQALGELAEPHGVARRKPGGLYRWSKGRRRRARHT